MSRLDISVDSNLTMSFKSVKPGEIFRYNGNLHMRVEAFSIYCEECEDSIDCYCRAVNLEDGSLVDISPYTEVENPTEAHLQVTF